MITMFNVALSAFGMSPKPIEAPTSEQILVGRLESLVDDASAWRDVVQEVLRSVAPNTQLKGLKEKVVLQTLFAMCEVQLTSHLPPTPDSLDLLCGVQRLLATRALHTHIPRFSIGFITSSAQGLLRAASSA